MPYKQGIYIIAKPKRRDNIFKELWHNHKIKIIIGAIIVLLLGINVYTLTLLDFKEENPIIIEEKEETVNKIKVDIKGEINAKGVYELEEGSRVADLIEKAGGLTNNADTSIINLSKKLEDEMVVFIYSYSEVKNFTKETTCNCPSVNDACIDNQLETLTEDNETISSLTSTGKISINTATTDQLQTLTGIGESKAKAIIEYRNTNGKFKTIEEIKQVKGIGDSIFEKIKDDISI